MVPEPERVVLPRGAVIAVRPIHAEDRELLQAGLAALDEASNYLRFHRIVRELSDDELTYLTDLDHRDHEAWGATVEVDGEPMPAGIARYVRLEGTDDAEAAVTVLKDFQGLGIGSFLLALLSRSAHRNGIRRFVGNVLAENRQMLEVFSHLEPVVEAHESEVTVYVDIPFVHEWARETADRVFESFYG